MRRSLPRLLLGVWLLAAGLTPVCVRAAWVDTSARTVFLERVRFPDEDYWRTHAIYLARITDIKTPSEANSSEPYVTTFVVIKSISGAIVGNVNRISTYPNSMVADAKGTPAIAPAAFPLGVNSNAILLVAENLDDRQPTVIRVMQFPDDQALVAVLEKIARLRAAPDLPAMLAGATSEFDLLSAYALNRLMALPGADISPADLTKLQSLANDDARNPDLRILAEAVALQFSVATPSGRTAAEYAWLRGVLEAAAQQANANPTDDYSKWYPFFTKMFAFQDRRLETADYALALAADENAPVTVRAAACSALSGVDSFVFQFQEPDARFDRMFTTYVNLLRDKSPEMRIMGEGMLIDRTVVILRENPSAANRPYLQKALAALQNAIKVETDPKVMPYLESGLEVYHLNFPGA